nr:DUF350 domain-containing protein [Calditerrivibrio nitroreducens]
MARTKGKYCVVEHISNGSISVGLLMAFISIAIGILNAGSMSY